MTLLSCLTVERDWRDKQKVADGLKDTVDKQRKDLDSIRREIMEKEMLCSSLRVRGGSSSSHLTLLTPTVSLLIHGR